MWMLSIPFWGIGTMMLLIFMLAVSNPLHGAFSGAHPFEWAAMMLCGPLSLFGFYVALVAMRWL